uniref:Uncharacterized protein n=1 Tax=Gasterosteus aculeatus aculeatus TaxID=481459 RepID=A0AAQ4S991_GASAC
MIFRTAVEHAKRHPGLIPQFFFICLGIGGASLYLFRLAKGPHVTRLLPGLLLLPLLSELFDDSPVTADTARAFNASSQLEQDQQP